MKRKILSFILGLVITAGAHAQSPPMTLCTDGILGILTPGSACPGASEVCVGTYDPGYAGDPNCTGTPSVSDPLCCVTVPPGAGELCWTAANSSCGANITAITGDECHRYMFSLSSTCGGGTIEDNWTAWWDGTKWNYAPYPIGHQSQITIGGTLYYDLQLGVDAGGNLEILVNGLSLVDNDGNYINW